MSLPIPRKLTGRSQRPPRMHAGTSPGRFRLRQRAHLASKPLATRLEDIYDLYEVELFACALAVTRCRELAADAVHDAFCSLLAIDCQPKDLKRYTFRAVRNAALQVVRRKRPSSGLPNDSFFDTSPGVEEQASRAEDHVRLNQALDMLPETQREVILQHLYSGLTFREISEMRNDSINTVASWYRRGLRELRGYLDKEQKQA